MNYTFIHMDPTGVGGGTGHREAAQSFCSLVVASLTESSVLNHKEFILEAESVVIF